MKISRARSSSTENWERKEEEPIMACELQLYRRHWTSRRRVVGDKRSNLVDSIDYWFFLNAKEKKKNPIHKSTRNKMCLSGAEKSESMTRFFERVGRRRRWHLGGKIFVCLFVFLVLHLMLLVVVVFCFSSVRPRHTLCINFRHVRFSSLLSMLIFVFFIISLVQPHFRAPLNYVLVQDDCSALSYANTVQFHNVQLFLINFDCFSHDGAMRYGSKTLLHTFAIFWALGLRAHNNSFIRKEGRDKWWWLWSENENDKSNFKWEISLCSLGRGRHVCWDASKTTEGNRRERGCVRGYGKKFKDFLSISKRRMWDLFGVRYDDT